MEINKIFKLFLIFVLALTCIFSNYINVYCDDISFEIIHEGDITYDGSDEPIILDTTIKNTDYYSCTLMLDGDQVDYYSLDPCTKKLTIEAISLKKMRKGTNKLTLNLYYDESLNPNHYSAEFYIISTSLTKENADLIINDKNNLILYSKDDQSANDIDGLKVIKPNQDSDTYIIKLEKDVELTSLNDDCIYTQFGCSLQIVGPHTLTINLDHDNEYSYSSAIKTLGDFILGDFNADYITNIVINDPFVLNNKDKNSPLCAYTFGIWTQNKLEIYKSKIVGNITSNLLLSRKEANIINTTLEHNVFANYTGNNDPYTIQNDGGDLVIEHCNIKSKVIPSESYADVSMTCIRSDMSDFESETIEKIYINDTIIEFEPVPLHTGKCCSYFIDSNEKILIENSDLKVKNSTYGIYTEKSTEIINTDVQMNSYNSNILCGNSLRLAYNDNEEHTFDLTTSSQEEIDFEQHFPSIYIFLLNENYELIPAPTDSLIVELPKDAVLSSDDETIDKDEIIYI